MANKKRSENNLSKDNETIDLDKDNKVEVKVNGEKKPDKTDTNEDLINEPEIAAETTEEPKADKIEPVAGYRVPKIADLKDNKKIPSLKIVLLAVVCLIVLIILVISFSHSKSPATKTTAATTTTTATPQTPASQTISNNIISYIFHDQPQSIYNLASPEFKRVVSLASLTQDIKLPSKEITSTQYHLS